MISSFPHLRKISKGELLGVLLFYLLFAFIYNLVLGYIAADTESSWFENYFGLQNFWNRAGMQYVLFLVGSLLIYLIGIYSFRNRHVLLQISTVVILIPVVIYVIRSFRYAILDAQNLWHLKDTASVWDLYIPSLFLLIQFGCFFAYRYFRENQQKLKEEGEMRQAVLKSELAAIKAQLNPHFLYNVFNTINASIPPENEKTRGMIAQLSDIFRYQLKASKKDLVPLEEELKFVKNYLNLEKERFGDRLQISIEVDPNLYHEKVPPMILQPLLENSIKHGLASKVDGGLVGLKIVKVGTKLRFNIWDTGKGVNHNEQILGKGTGLTNTNLRLQKMYNSELIISDNKPSGLKIQFEI